MLHQRPHAECAHDGQLRVEAERFEAAHLVQRARRHHGVEARLAAQRQVFPLPCHDEPHRYTFWDYQAGAFQKNQGLRIDHLLLSPQAADRLQACEIDPAPRSWEKPSDHVPIWIELAV